LKTAARKGLQVRVLKFPQVGSGRISFIELRCWPSTHRLCATENPTFPLLMQYFHDQAEQKIKSAGLRKVEDDAVDALLDYSWPGNVRQLRHVVEKLAVDTLGGSVINADAVRRALDNHRNVGLCCAGGRQPIAAYAECDSLDDFLDRAMLNLYQQVRGKTGSHSQTARELRIDRTSLYQRLERARRRLYLSTVNETVASIF